MKIYTRTGDQGETGLYGAERVPKDDIRVEAYGTVDEANALLGLVRAHLTGEMDDLNQLLSDLQNTLFDLGADLATRHGGLYEKNLVRIDEHDVEGLERLIDRYTDEAPPLTGFVHPGGQADAAFLQVARAVVRRAERRTVSLARREEINAEVIRYLNRLSDLLFVLARVVNARVGVLEADWRVGARR